MPFVKLNVNFRLAHWIDQWEARKLTSVLILASSLRDWSSWPCKAFQSFLDAYSHNFSQIALFLSSNVKTFLSKITNDLTPIIHVTLKFVQIHRILFTYQDWRKWQLLFKKIQLNLNVLMSLKSSTIRELRVLYVLYKQISDF